MPTWEVESLLQSDGLSRELGLTALSQDVKNNIIRDCVTNYTERQGAETVNFESFAGIICSVIETKDRLQAPKALNLRLSDLLPLDPDSPAKQTWDVFVLLLLLYTSFQIPFTLAFADAADDDALTPFQAWLLALDCLFLLDMLLTFATKVEHKGVLISDPSRIARSYLTTWFLTDLVGSFPFDLVIRTVLADSVPGGGSIKLLRVVKVARLAKILHLARTQKKRS
jgi:hypothetical protein